MSWHKFKVPLAGFAALAVLGSSACAGGSGSSEPKQLVVSVWGGDTQQFLQKVVEPVFKKQHPGVHVTYDVGSSTQRYNKALASKSRPQDDVMFQEPIVMAQAIKGGIIQKFDQKRVPNNTGTYSWADPLPGYAVVLYNIAYVLAYNPDYFAKHPPVPTSWKDLWRPGLRHRIAVPAIGHSQTVPFVEVTRKAFGGADPYAKLAQLKPRAQTFFYTDWNGLYDSGDVVLATEFDYYVNSMRAKGENVKYVIPKEGGFGSQESAAVVKGIDDSRKKLAEDYINTLMSTEVQKQVPSKLHGMPAKTAVSVPPQLCAQLASCGSREKQLLWPRPNEYAAQVPTVVQQLKQKVQGAWGAS